MRVLDGRMSCRMAGRSRVVAEMRYCRVCRILGGREVVLVIRSRSARDRGVSVVLCLAGSDESEPFRLVADKEASTRNNAFVLFSDSLTDLNFLLTRLGAGSTGKLSCGFLSPDVSEKWVSSPPQFWQNY